MLVSSLLEHVILFRGEAHLGRSDADVVILLLHGVRLVGLDIDLGADAEIEDGRDVENAAALLGDDLQLSNNVGHVEELRWV